MKLYECIIDDGQNVFKTVTAAKNRKELLNVYGGNGKFEKIRDVTNDYPIDENKLDNTLRVAGYGQTEINLLTALLFEHNKTLR